MMDPPWSAGTILPGDGGWEEVEDDMELESEALANPALADSIAERTVDEWACYLVASCLDNAAVESVQDLLLLEEPQPPVQDLLLLEESQPQTPEPLPQTPEPKRLIGIAGVQEEPLDEPNGNHLQQLLSPTSAASSDGGSKGTQWLYNAGDSKDFLSADDGDMVPVPAGDSSYGLSGLPWTMDREDDVVELDDKDDANIPDLDEDDISIPRRPVAPAEHRPETRGTRSALVSQPAVAPSFTSESRVASESRGGDGAPKKQRKIVYVDHHHVHHHHHFHQPGDWTHASPGELPPEYMQKKQEKKAQADVEQWAGPLENSAQPQAKAARALPPRALPGRVRSHGRQRRGKSKGSRGIDASLPGFSHHAEHVGESSRFAQDASSRFKASFVNDVSLQLPENGSVVHKATSKDDLPLQQYFQLMARLPMENRLKLSPYGVSLSAR